MKTYTLSKILIYSSILIFLIAISWTILFEPSGPASGVGAAVVGLFISLPMFLIGFILMFKKESTKDNLLVNNKKIINWPLRIAIFISFYFIFSMIWPFNMIFGTILNLPFQIFYQIF